jgi:hypothetical protein
LKKYFLNIAEIIFQVQTEDDRIVLQPEPGLQHFMTTKFPDHFDITVNVTAGKPDMNGFTQVFVASADDHHIQHWNIMGREDQFCLYANIRNENSCEIFAIFDLSFRTWNIYLHSQAENIIHIDPFTHPVGTIILLYSTLLLDGIMLHASGVQYNNKGFIFCGFSGKGKSTIAEIFSNAGAEYINDDRLIIRKINEKFFIFNTPMPYPDFSKSAALDKCFFLEHASKNYFTPLSKTQSIARLSASCLQHNFHSDLISMQLEQCTEIANAISAGILGFYPNQQILELIDTISK